MKSKWFKFEGKEFGSKKQAEILNLAWDKTLEKWALKMDRYRELGESSTCGLCNYYRDRSGGGGCLECPISYSTYGEVTVGGNNVGCIPTQSSSLEYLFLLIVKEATYKGRNK